PFSSSTNRKNHVPVVALVLAVQRSRSMGILWRGVGGTIVFLLAVSTLRSADEEKELRATIAKAIQAEHRDGKTKGLTMKGTGTFFGLGEGIPFSGEWHSQGDTQS